MAKEIFKLGGLDKTKTVFLLCDIQEKFKPAMEYFDQVCGTANKMITASKIFNIPLFVTEQNSKGLGSTDKSIDISTAKCVIPKSEFSMKLPEMDEQFKCTFQDNLKSVVIFGVEAHVCVEITAIDYIKAGYAVHIVADGTVSRSQEDRMLAFKRMRQIGCFVATSENIIFKLLMNSKAPEFKKVAKLIRPTTLFTGLAPKNEPAKR